MAVRYYGVAPGGSRPADVTVDSSTTSAAIELAVNDASLPVADEQSKALIIEALEAIKLALVGDDR